MMMKSTIFRICQGLAFSAVFCQALANPVSAQMLDVRRISRKTNVQNLDRVDSIKWFATESIRYTVAPYYRDGTPVEIPASATASWIVADAAGTNWLAVAGGIENSNAVFRVPSGEAAIPPGTYSSFAILLDGTNLLGVIDKTAATVLWGPDDSMQPIGPATNTIAAIVAQLVRDFGEIQVSVAENADAIATNAANISSNTVELYWQALHLSEHEGRLLANERAIEDLQAAAGHYVLRTNGAWVIVQGANDQSLTLNGATVWAAHADVEGGAKILGMDTDGDDLILRFYGGSSNRCESCTNTEDWVEIENCQFSQAGEIGICRVIDPDSGSWFRIVSSDDVPARTNAWLQASAPLYLGDRENANRAATKGDVAASAEILRRTLDDYALLTGYEETPGGMIPEEPAIAWNLSPTGSTFNALCIGGNWRTNWPQFETGGPLYPCFAQATGLTQNITWPHYIPIGPEEDFDGVTAMPLVKQFCSTLDTSAAGWTNVRSSVAGAEPHFVSTDTMIWSEGDPWGYSTSEPWCNATGFWPAVEQKVGITCEWAVAIGTYTGKTQIAVLAANPAETNWGWVGETPGTLRAALSAPLEALAAAEGKSTSIWADSADLATTNAVRNPDFWAAAIDLTPVSTWCDHNGFTYTAITRSHFLTAKHCTPSVGHAVTWYTPDNTAVTRTIAAIATIGTNDCRLALLDSPLPETITPARIIRTNDWPKFVANLPNGWPVVSRRGQRGHRIAALHPTRYGGRLVWFDADLAASWTDGNIEHPLATTNSASAYSTFSRYDGQSAPFIGGDSGSPILLWDGTQTIIAETLHYADGAGPNISLLAPAIEAQIQAWGGTTETNLYWADFSAWPDYTPNPTETP